MKLTNDDGAEILERESADGYHFRLVIDGKVVAKGDIASEVAYDFGVSALKSVIRAELQRVAKAYRDGTLYPPE